MCTGGHMWSHMYISMDWFDLHGVTIFWNRSDSHVSVQSSMFWCSDLIRVLRSTIRRSDRRPLYRSDWFDRSISMVWSDPNSSIDGNLGDRPMYYSVQFEEFRRSEVRSKCTDRGSLGDRQASVQFDRRNLGDRRPHISAQVAVYFTIKLL